MSFRPGWYVLLYHEVSWEENPYLRGIGGHCPPDLLREHTAALAKVGDLVSVDAGFEAWRSGRIRRPTFSFWFDDGLVGVRKYALPILQQQGITSAISICSRFTSREEMFWRFKLSFLCGCDGLRFLRTRCKRFGYTFGESLKTFSLDRFSPALVEELDATYRELTTELQRSDAFRLFDRPEGLKSLREAGWWIANHSAAHYPIAETTAIDQMHDQFRECDDYLCRDLGVESNYCVIPFDRRSKRVPDLVQRFRSGASDRCCVLVGNEINRPDAADHSVLRRIYMPMEPPRAALRFLRGLSYGD